MPKQKSIEEWVKPYAFHGLDLTPNSAGTEASGPCPWCDDDQGKFNLGLDTGQWRCWKCRQGNEKGGGNLAVFLKMLWERSDVATKDYEALRADRGLRYPDTLMHWGAAQSILTGVWVLPGYSTSGVLVQLYKYTKVEGKGRLLATPGVGHALFGMPLYRRDCVTVYACEGPWDAMALWEVMKECKHDDEGRLIPTASAENNLLATASVLAVPGNMVFFPAWAPLFAGKRVVLMYDSDHPKKDKAGRVIPPAGLQGMQHAAKVLSSVDEPPAEIRYLKWGKDGYDPSLPSGYDVRDKLTK